MKKYKYTFSSLIIGLFILGMVISVACIVLNVIRLINNINSGNEVSGYDYFILVLVVVLSLFFIVIAISSIVSSRYEITDKKIILRWGFIKNVIDINEIKELKYYPDKNRLELLFTDDAYFYVSTKPEWVYDFVDEIKVQSPKITFLQESDIASNNG